MRKKTLLLLCLYIFFFVSHAKADCSSCYNLFQVNIKLKTKIMSGYIIAREYSLSFDDYIKYNENHIKVIKNLYNKTRSPLIPSILYYSEEDLIKINKDEIITIEKIKEEYRDDKIQMLPMNQVQLFLNKETESVFTWDENLDGLLQKHYLISYNKSYAEKRLEEIVNKFLYLTENGPSYRNWIAHDLKLWEEELNKLKKDNVFYIVMGDGC